MKLVKRLYKTSRPVRGEKVVLLPPHPSFPWPNDDCWPAGTEAIIYKLPESDSDITCMVEGPSADGVGTYVNYVRKYRIGL